MWYELVQWRIEETDIYWIAIHSLKDTLEVSLLVWEKLSKRFLTTLSVLRKNHLTHSHDLLILEEHVLCTGQTNTLSTEVTSHLCIVWSISIGTNLEMCIFVAEIHQLFEVAAQFSSLSWDLTCINLTSRTVQ